MINNEHHDKPEDMTDEAHALAVSLHETFAKLRDIGFKYLVVLESNRGTHLSTTCFTDPEMIRIMDELKMALETGDYNT